MVCGSATPFVPQGVPPNLFKLFCAVPKCTRFLEPQIECGPCRQKFDPASNRFHLRQPAVRFESRFDLGM